MAATPSALLPFFAATPPPGGKSQLYFSCHGSPGLGGQNLNDLTRRSVSTVLSWSFSEQFISAARYLLLPLAMLAKLDARQVATPTGAAWSAKTVLRVRERITGTAPR
jgi:hypothetical protein